MELKVKYDLPFHAQHREDYKSTGIEVTFPLDDSDYVDCLEVLMADNGFRPVEIDLETDMDDGHWENADGYAIEVGKFQEMAEIIDSMDDNEIEAFWAYTELIRKDPKMFIEDLVDGGYTQLRKVAKSKDELINRIYQEHKIDDMPDFVQNALWEYKENFWEEWLKYYVYQASNGIWIQD